VDPTDRAEEEPSYMLMHDNCHEQIMILKGPDVIRASPQLQLVLCFIRQRLLRIFDDRWQALELQL
jgi:hypothetical protein